MVFRLNTPLSVIIILIQTVFTSEVYTMDTHIMVLTTTVLYYHNNFDHWFMIDSNILSTIPCIRQHGLYSGQWMTARILIRATPSLSAQIAISRTLKKDFTRHTSWTYTCIAFTSKKFYYPSTIQNVLANNIMLFTIIIHCVY